MNAYLDIFSDVLRLVTFQDRQRPLRREFPEIAAAFPVGTRRSQPERIAGSAGGGQPSGKPLCVR